MLGIKGIHRILIILLLIVIGLKGVIMMGANTDKKNKESFRFLFYCLYYYKFAG